MSAHVLSTSNKHMTGSIGKTLVSAAGVPC